MIIIGDAKNLDPTIFPTKYSVIVLDPPWAYDRPILVRQGGYDYQTMTEEEIGNIPIKDIANKKCAIYCWVTWPKMNIAIKVIEKWGAEYVTGFPWIKLNEKGDSIRYGTGQWVAGCSEAILIARFGNVSPPPSPKYLGLIGGWVFNHSHKPNNIHEMAEKLSGPYLEMFARRTRPGWDSFGNEVEDLETGMIYTDQPNDRTFNVKLF